MTKLKQIGILLLSGTLAFGTPASVMASDTMDSILEIAEDLLENNEIQSLISDPDKVADIIIFVKNQVDQLDVTEEDIRSAIDMAADEFQVELTDSDKDSLVKIAKKLIELDMDDEEIRRQVKNVYSAMETLGVDNEEVKGLLEKALDFVKSIIG